MNERQKQRTARMNGETVGKLTTRTLDGTVSSLTLYHEAAPQICQAYRIKFKFYLETSFLLMILACRGYYKVPWTRGHRQQKFMFLTLLEAGSLKLGCRQGWFLWRPPSMAYRQLPPSCFLTRCSFCACACPNLLYLQGHPG